MLAAIGRKNPTELVLQTNYHRPSMVVQMSLADLLLQFLLPYKGAANFKRINVTFVPVFSKNLMTEILCNFWKEPPCTIQLRLGTICETNVRCLVAVCYFLAGSTPQSRFLRLHHPLMVFPKFTLDEYKCSFCLQEASFFLFYRFYQFTNIEVTNTSFLRRFIFV